MSLTNERPTYLDDVIVWEADNARDAVTFKNNTGGTLTTVPIGRTLILSGSYYVPAPLTNADAVLLTALTSIANNGTAEVAVIGLRGNCTLNSDALQYGNVGTTENYADQQLAALSSQGVKFVSESTVSSNG